MLASIFGSIKRQGGTHGSSSFPSGQPQTHTCSNLTTREFEFREWANMEKLLRAAAKKWNQLARVVTEEDAAAAGEHS